MYKKIILLCLLLLTPCWLYAKHGRSRQLSANNADVWVKVEAVKKVNMPLKLSTLGNMTAKSVVITPEIAGHVKQVLFKDGVFVEKGQALLQLEDSVYKSKYESAKAGLLYSTQDYQRKKLLGTRGAIANQAIDQAKADLKEKQSLAEDARVMLAKTLLRAPFAGKLSKTNVNPGDYVTIGQALVTITDTEHLRVEYNLPENNIPYLKLGQTVEVKSPAYPKKAFTGVVSFISPTLNSTTRSIALYADIINQADALIPGMFVNVQQVLNTKREVLLIPAKSLVPRLDGEEVYKIIDGKAFATKVSVGKRTADSVEILNGLNVHDVIVTDGQLKIQDGLAVKIKT